MSFGKTTPVLCIHDEDQALAFYVGLLGFCVDWQHRCEPGGALSLQVSRGDCVLHLSEHPGDATPGAALRIETDELEAFRGRLLANTAGDAPPRIQAMPWGSLDMALNDPFGNRLVFTQAIYA